jgi:flagellar operon protein
MATDKLLFIGGRPIQPEGTGRVRPASNQPLSGANGGFAQVFQREVEKSGELKFSAHAEKRIQSRQIPFTATDMAELKSAVDRAAAKGARESLVLMGDMAFIVSVKNRTVITAIDGNNLKENVFTNIDSAVIAKS